MKTWLFLALFAAAPLPAATIAATGGWTLSLATANLVGGAGTDLVSNYQSSASVILIDVTGTPLIGSYHVYARVAATGVPPGVTIAVKRTTDGNSLLPLALITGGTSYVTLTTTDTEIFFGELDRYSIALQLRASGVSVGITPSTYLSNVILSVTP